MRVGVSEAMREVVGVGVGEVRREVRREGGGGREVRREGVGVSEVRREGVGVGVSEVRRKVGWVR